MQIHPIRNDADHRKALSRIASLITADADSPQGEELDILTTLAAAYEARRFPMDAPTPVAAILFRMEQEHLSRKDLESMLGSRARVSEVLSGKRNLTLPMIRRVRGQLGISADLLIAPLPLPRGRESARKQVQEQASSRQGALPGRKTPGATPGYPQRKGVAQRNSPRYSG